MSHLVVSVVDEVNTAVQELLGAQHLPVILQPDTTNLSSTVTINTLLSHLKVLQSTSREKTES